MTGTRAALLALAPALLHALAREADRGLGLVLRAEIEPRGVLVEVGRAMAADPAGAAARVALWLAGGAALWGALVARRQRADGVSRDEAIRREALVLAPLLLRPAITLLALLSLAVRASWPYGFTLPVALTQDWAIGQDAAVVAVLLALRAPVPRLPGPRAVEVLVLSFLAYAALVPDWAWRWDNHPGNEPKYLRQAVALGHGLTFDAEGVSAAMEELPTRPIADSIPAAASVLVRESLGMASALLRADAGRDAIRATRVTRQTIRGKDGGVFYVLAPGPSLLLAPALRADRAVNRARGEPGRVAVSVLAWCALAALLVMALFLLVRDATGRPGLAAALAFAFALVPPFLFYFFQFYPEMVGALVMALAFRALALRPESLRLHPWRFGWMLATLPWLHQKFLPVWLVLVATALVVGAGRPRRGWPGHGLLVPTATSLYLTALYNFAITGSVRPDALFLAWGPGGVTSARVGQGVLGLVLDARYGILPYVPVLLLAAGGLALGGARRFAVVLPAVAVYYLTVASADNWAGAVCNLGRYVMPVAPLAVALVGVAIHGAPRRAAVALALVLLAWTGLFAVALWQDPHAANDSALLLAKSTYADGNQYLPNLFIRRWSDGAPGLWARIGAWLAALAAAAVWLRRVASAHAREGSRRDEGPIVLLATLAGLVLAAGLVLEQWPGRRSAPSFAARLALPAAAPAAAPPGPPPVAFLGGAARVQEDHAVLGPGPVEVLLRRPAAVTRLPATVGGAGGVLRAEGLPPLVLRPTGVHVSLPFVPYHVVRGREGREVAFSRATLRVEGEAVLRLEMEPDGRPDR